ncbi:MAG: hypothetical protein Q8Q31_05460 [Nanoarchaeota archaeon]|nr:hypothetical protein [Nanoarchaeota archaeon]
MDLEEIKKVAFEIRKKFESKQVDKEELKELYLAYHDVCCMDDFLEQAEKIFPRLNCGLTSVYLQKVLRRGEIIKGYYENNPHTFLLIDNLHIVDITADQYQGPEVYVGPLTSPWSLNLNYLESKKVLL